MKPIKVGFLGGGSIAGTVAKALQGRPEIDTFGIATRDPERSRAFAKTHRFTRAFSSYQALAACPDIDLIYIATPHALHYSQALLCLEHRKAVLCEKAFTATAWQAKALIDKARQERTLLAEAIWTRYLPARSVIDGYLQRGLIGRPSGLVANLGYPVSHVARMVQPELAGGALLDLGVYPINFALMAFGTAIKQVTSACTFLDSGVDAANSITLTYDDGKLAVLTSTQVAQTDRRGCIFGDRGYLVVDNINNPQLVQVYDAGHQLLESWQADPGVSGYVYQFLEMAKCLAQGRTESPLMPLDETLRVMRLMDALRKDWGLVYPADQQQAGPAQ